MSFYTADICDEIWDKAQVLEDGYNSYGGVQSFSGEIVTIKIDEDNSSLIELLKEDGNNKVAVVEVQRAYKAVVGENLMKLALKNGWSGIVVNGYVRDITFTKDIAVGLVAVGTCPKKSQKKAQGVVGQTLSFGGVNFTPEHTLYADEDGIIVVDEL